MTRIAFFSRPHPFARALVAALAKSCEVTLAPLDPEPEDGERVSRVAPAELRAGEEASVLICPGVPFSAENPPDLGALLRRLATSTDARRITLLSSAAVYEPRPGHPGFVTERPAEKLRDVHPVARAWIEIERESRRVLAASKAGEPPPLLILRPCPVLVPDAEDLFSRLFAADSRAKRATVLPGHDPSLQLLSVNDLASLVLAALESRFDGVLHAAPDSVVPLRAALRLVKRRPLPLPRSVQAITRSLSPRSRALPAQVLDYIRYQFNVSPECAFDELGWSAATSSTRAVVELQRQLPDGTVSPSRAADAVAETSAISEATFDRYGLDPDYLDLCSRRVWRFAHDHWFRVEVRGIENVPTEGAAVLSGIHRGWIQTDAMMLLHVIHRDLGRAPRFLIHPALIKQPFLFDLMRKVGGVIACQPSADDLLERGSIVAILPEGVSGAFAEYRNAYRLASFRRSDFVRLALRHQAPIVPFVTIGPAESLPIFKLWKWSWWRKKMGWPGLPISPTFPLWPLGLPAKWHTWILPPIDVAARFGPSAANDREVVQEISDEFRERLETALAWMLERRRSIWRGKIFEGPSPVLPGSGDPELHTKEPP